MTVRGLFSILPKVCSLHSTPLDWAVLRCLTLTTTIQKFNNHVGAELFPLTYPTMITIPVKNILGKTVHAGKNSTSNHTS